MRLQLGEDGVEQAAVAWVHLMQLAQVDPDLRLLERVEDLLAGQAPELALAKAAAAPGMPPLHQLVVLARVALEQPLERLVGEQRIVVQPVVDLDQGIAPQLGVLRLPGGEDGAFGHAWFVSGSSCFARWPAREQVTNLCAGAHA